MKSLFLILICLFANLSFAENKYYETKIGDINYGVFTASKNKIRLHWQDKNNNNFKYLSEVKKYYEQQNIQIDLLMNAGIYNTDFKPAGLWIEKGKILNNLNTRNGKGNFHLQPNGVFYIAKNDFGILSTQDYKKRNIKALWAVQSGPMLLINGKINSRFPKNIASYYKRNAVCLTEKKEILFVMTIATDDKYPNLYRFARDLQKFDCREALYLDGSISSWYVRNHRESTFHWQEFVGIIAVLP